MKTIKNDHIRRNVTKKNHKPSTKQELYSNVNYDWIKKECHAKDKNMTMDLIIKKRVNHQMEYDVLDSLLKERTKNGEQVRNIYKSSTHWNDDLVEKRMQNYIEKLNKYRENNDNMCHCIAWFINEGINAPIGLDIDIDPKKTHDYILHLTENGITFMNKNTYFSNEKKYRSVRKAYINFLKKIFAIIFGKNHSYKVENVFEIEKKLAENLLSHKDFLYVKNIYNVYDQNKCANEIGLDLNKFLQCIGYKIPPKNVVIENPKYMKNVLQLLKNWNNEEWKTYWVYQIISVASKFHKDLFRIFLDFFNKINKIPITKTTDVKKIALTNVETYMNAHISKKYLELFKNEKEIVFTKDLVRRYIKVFKKRLIDNTWLHSDTKSRSLKKLENMTIVVGFKEKWEPDPNLEYSSVDAWNNFSVFNKWSINRDIHLVGKRMSDKNVWIQMEDQNVYDVNAYYNSLENELIFPNAILQKPFVDVEKNMSYNLASIGTTIGHEMIHAFDDDGYYYDENGVYVENGWWHKNDMEEYERKQNKVVVQYENAAKMDKFKIDGRLSLTENIADIGGFLLTEAVLIDYLNDKEIYGAEQETHLKDFYTNYARNWRSNQSIKFYKKKVNEDEHAYSKYRVNCVLSNSKNFQRIFHIAPGSKMYTEIEEIW